MMLYTQSGVKAHCHTREYSKKDKVIFLLYYLYFILIPFYLWESGLPQIADFIMILLVAVYSFAKGFKFSFRNKNIAIIGLVFVAYIVIVNSIWTMIIPTSSRFLISSTFYIYNYIVVIVVMALYNDYGKKLIKITFKALLTSLIIQVGMYLIGGGFGGGRITGNFNNPNQLGYYGLVALAILMFSSNKVDLRIRWFVLSIIAAITLVFASLSKAAIISSVCMTAVFIFSGNQNRKFKRGIILTVIAASVFGVAMYKTTTIIQDSQLISSVETRINAIGRDSDDSIAGRGYSRIKNFPQYWVFGAGEGEYTRFGFGTQNMEFHSTLGNIQVSYGLIGTVLFVSIFLIALKNDRFRSWYILAFIFAYGMTHNGVRESMLWVLLALMASCSSVSEKNKVKNNG